MTRSTSKNTAVLIVCALVCGCGSAEDSAAGRTTNEQRTASAPRAAGGESSSRSSAPALGATLPTTVVRFNEASELDAGRREDAAVPSGPYALEWGTDGGPMVTEDAGPRSAEIAWLVSHLDEGVESAGPVGAPNVRALAGYGAEGVRAVIPLFRSGDARRVPHARKVIEMVARRACRGTSDVLAPRRLVAWLESGVAVVADPRAGTSAPSWPWTRAPEAAWPQEGLDRIRAWSDRALFCVPPDVLVERAPPASRAVDAGRTLLDARAP